MQARCNEAPTGWSQRVRSLPLSLVFADCVPVVLYDARRHILGVCHSGWRGTVQGITAATLHAMVDEYAVDPADVHAGIGPSIGPDSYEVGPEVVEAASGFFTNVDELITYRKGARILAYLLRRSCRQTSFQPVGSQPQPLGAERGTSGTD